VLLPNPRLSAPSSHLSRLNAPDPESEAII
jgi:hypothetical protein